MKLIVFCTLLLSSLTVDATNYFRWGWEDTRPSFGVNGRSSSNVTYGCPASGAPAGSCTTRDCTVAHSGSCSMKLVIVGNDSNNQPMGVETGYDGSNIPAYPFNIIRSGPSLYFRWWMRINTGFSWGSGTAKVKSNRINGTGVERVYTGYMMKYGPLIGECETACKTNTGSNNTDDKPTSIWVEYDMTTMSDSTWHEYIVMIKPNSSATCTAGTNCDAQLKFWVDGVLIGSNVNWKLWATSGIAGIETAWMLRPYWQLGGTVSDGGTIYIDDVSVDTSYNGWVAPSTLSVLDTGRFMATNMGNWKSLHPYL